jgi:hypothetical protein
MISKREAAKGYAAVGSEPRLDVLLLLIKAGEEGLTIMKLAIIWVLPPRLLPTT